MASVSLASSPAVKLKSLLALLNALAALLVHLRAPMVSSISSSYKWITFKLSIQCIQHISVVLYTLLTFGE